MCATGEGCGKTQSKGRTTPIGKFQSVQDNLHPAGGSVGTKFESQHTRWQVKFNGAVNQKLMSGKNRQRIDVLSERRFRR
jgi:hypothetical protein